LKECGCNRTAAEIKSKINNLKTEYRKMKPKSGIVIIELYNISKVLKIVDNISRKLYIFFKYKAISSIFLMRIFLQSIFRDEEVFLQTLFFFYFKYQFLREIQYQISLIIQYYMKF